MLFALVDYLNYRLRKGRFARDVTQSPMGAAFEGNLPENVFRVIRPADILFVQTLNSFASWLVMYFTRSEISHVASYLGNGRIGHSTLSGVVIESIDSLYEPSTLILPCTWPVSDEKRGLVEPKMRELVGTPYGWLPAGLKALRIITGRDWPYFRWSFLVDLALILIVFDTPFLVMFGHPFFLWLLPAYFVVIVTNYVWWKIRPLKFSEETAKPCEFFSLVMSQGGAVVFDAYAIHQQQDGVR